MLRCFGSRANGWRGSTFNVKTALVPNIERLKFDNKSIIQEVRDQQKVAEVETRQKNLIKDEHHPGGPGSTKGHRSRNKTEEFHKGCPEGNLRISQDQQEPRRL